MNISSEIISVDLDQAYRLLGYGPCVMVSTFGENRPNAAAIAWCCPTSKSPPTFALSIGSRHRTYRDLVSAGRFCINVPTVADLDTVLYTGSVSGNRVDKFAERGLEYRPGDRFPELPLMVDASAWLECRLLPGYDGENALVVGVAEAASCRRGVLGSDGTWNEADYPTLHHLGGRNFLIGRERMVADPARR